jgi:hypothetical protein
MGDVKKAQPELERVAGIEPASSAWKAEVLPLNYTRMDVCFLMNLPFFFAQFISPPTWWRGVDSNHRRQSRQIYSLIPLAAREPLRKK